MRFVLAIVSAMFLYAQPTLAEEVTQCFEKAWANPGNGGLGMPRGLAVDLCRGSTNAKKVTQCYEKAWANPGNGGLGMPRNSAVDLCATTPRAK
jgi:hypothetical protein